MHLDVDRCSNLHYMDIRGYFKSPVQTSQHGPSISGLDTWENDFTPSQRCAMEKIKQGKNVFVTGPAGTGKSYLINKIQDWANREFKKIALTAMTGAAAQLIGGKTIHSWSCIGILRDSVVDTIEKCRKRKHIRERWRQTRVLVIDEVSMMSKEVFEYLDQVARGIRNNPRPFGGIQLILCGDFCQLPPIHSAKDGKAFEFCFESSLWTTAVHETLELKEIMRQKDPVFQDCLRKIRLGTLDDEVTRLLESRVGLSTINQQGIQPTLIYPFRANVQKLNNLELKKLREPLMEFVATTQNVATRDKDKVFQDLPCAEKLYLAKGAQVMLNYNLDQDKGLVNGSRGIIKSFHPISQLPMVEFLNGLEETIEFHDWKIDESTGNNASATSLGKKSGSKNTSGERMVRQLPLVLGWAITIHKSQGVSLDLARIDIGSNIFEYGQSYVALSRVRNLQGLYIDRLDVSKIKIHPKVKAFMEKMST